MSYVALQSVPGGSSWPPQAVRARVARTRLQKTMRDFLGHNLKAPLSAGSSNVLLLRLFFGGGRAGLARAPALDDDHAPADSCPEGGSLRSAGSGAGAR